MTQKDREPSSLQRKFSRDPKVEKFVRQFEEAAEKATNHGIQKAISPSYISQKAHLLQEERWTRRFNKLKESPQYERASRIVSS